MIMMDLIVRIIVSKIFNIYSILLPKEKSINNGSLTM